MELNNPVARLYDLLTSLKKQAQPRVKLREVWAGYFGLDRNDTASLLTAGADVIYLIRDARTTAARLEHPANEKPFSPIEKVFASANLDIDAKQFADRIGDRTMGQLEIIAAHVDSVAREPLIERDTLDEWLVRIEELMDEVPQADFEQQLKVALLDALDEMRSAIKMYRARGAKGLAVAMTRVVGVYGVHGINPDKEPDDSVLARCWMLAKEVAQAVQVLEAGRAIGATIAGLLPA